MLLAYRAYGATIANQGNILSALDYYEKGISLYDPAEHHSLAYLFGQDFEIVFHAYSAIFLWLLGKPDQSLVRNAAGLRLAQTFAHPLTLAFALFFSACLHQFRQEVKMTRNRAEEAINLCNRHGFSLWLGWTSVLMGWAMAKEGDLEAGLSQMEKGLTDSKGTGAALFRTYFLSLLVEIQIENGLVDQAQNTLHLAFAEIQNNGELFWEPELVRQKGEILERLGKPFSEIEMNYCLAIEKANTQHALSQELRAKISLAHLWKENGLQDQVRNMLTETLKHFNEGADTTDVLKAKAILENVP
jgi:predicted ATPase